MRLTQKIQKDRDVVGTLIHNLIIIDCQRKDHRKDSAKLLREYSHLISDKKIRSKIRGNYFRDLVDLRVIETLQDIYKKM
jgi:hypothetical protein